MLMVFDTTAFLDRLLWFISNNNRSRKHLENGRAAMLIFMFSALMLKKAIDTS
jgi:hypothetical protein